MTVEITYRMLRPDEWPKVEPIFIEHGGPQSLPCPEASAILVAEEQGGIVGFLVIQPVVHAEPVWVREDHRGNGIARKLFSEVDDFMKGIGIKAYYTFSTETIVERLAQGNGMSLLPWKVWMKEARN